MTRPVPAAPPPAPVVQRLVIRYAKRGRMRFASHRDIARAIERGVRRASLPVAFSAGFSPHPKISYAGGAPTGTASEAEYLEIALTSVCPATDVRDRLDVALPDGIDVIEVLEPADAPGGAGALRLEGSQWRVVLPGVAPAEAARAVQAFLAADSIMVERLTSKGIRRLDARAAVVSLELDRRAEQGANAGYVTLHMVVRHLTPAVRPDDVLAALSKIAALEPPSPPLVTRLAQGPIGRQAETGDARNDAAISARETPATRQETETRLAPAGTAAISNAAPPDAPATAHEQLPRGAQRPDPGPRTREYDRRLPACSKPSDTTENQTTTTRPQAPATPLA
jgi:radical SAM-linked protein